MIICYVEMSSLEIKFELQQVGVGSWIQSLGSLQCLKATSVGSH